MSEKEEGSTNNSRRNFLQKLGFVSVGSVLAGAAIYSGYEYQNKKKVGDKIKILTSNNELLEIDREAAVKSLKKAKLDLTTYQKQGREGIVGKRWIWVIDLSKCKNARKCMGACISAHHLRSEQSHINVLMMQESKETPPYYMPKPCQHCDNPPCVAVCPVDATFKRQDGIVLIDNERCIGCRLCMEACPYSVRVFNWERPKDGVDALAQPYSPEWGYPRRIGTVEKCDFCADMADEGMLPHCSPGCPMGGVFF